MKSNHDEHPMNHIGQISFFALFFIVWASDSFHLKWSTFLAQSIPFWVRLGFFLLSLLFVILVFRAVISSFPKEDGSSKVINTGPFKFVRHPMYLACMVFYFSFSFFTCSMLSLGVLFIIFIFYDRIASYEEKRLIETFGKSYVEYMQIANRWIPNLTKNRRH